MIDTVPVDVGYLHQRLQLLGSLDYALQGWRESPVEQPLACQAVATGERRGGAPVAQEVAEQGVDGLGTRGVLAEDAGPLAPAEQLGKTGHRACLCGGLVARERSNWRASAAAGSDLDEMAFGPCCGSLESLRLHQIRA